MNWSQYIRSEGLLIRLGSLVLVFQLIVFQQAFDIIENPGVEGTLREVVSGGLSLIAAICLVSGVWLRFQTS